MESWPIVPETAVVGLSVCGTVVSRLVRKSIVEAAEASTCGTRIHETGTSGRSGRSKSIIKESWPKSLLVECSLTILRGRCECVAGTIAWAARARTGRWRACNVKRIRINFAEQRLRRELQANIYKVNIMLYSECATCACERVLCEFLIVLYKRPAYMNVNYKYYSMEIYGNIEIHLSSIRTSGGRRFAVVQGRNRLLCTNSAYFRSGCVWMCRAFSYIMASHM